MRAIEKQLRYQALSKLNKMKKDGAKPATIERLSRSMTPQRGGVQKGQVFKGRNR